MSQALSLFSGAGGGALAAKASGYQVVACIDSDKDACATLRANGFTTLQADVKTFDWSIFDDIQAVVGGPPCQPFSAATTGAGFEDPRDCIPDFIRAVDVIRPRLFVLENVRGLTFKRHAEYLQLVIDSFPDEYNIDYRVLNAADYGVPQTRQRLFIVGRLDDRPVWPVQTHSPLKKLIPGTQPWVPAGTVLTMRDLEPEQAWILERPATTVVGSFGAGVLAGPGYRTKGDPSRQNAVGTIEVSHRERARIQNFPEDWEFVGSKSSIDRQLGNACPPALLQAVITANEEIITPVSPHYFLGAVQRAWDKTKGGLSVGSQLSYYQIEALATKDLFLSRDGLTGVAVEDGDLQSLFNIGPKGRGVAAATAAVRAGARTLDCFEPFLPGWYGRQGWVLDHVEENWDPGGPQVAYMRFEGVAP